MTQAELLAALPWAALTIAIWLSFYLVRKFAPKLWSIPALHSVYDWLVVNVIPPAMLSKLVPVVDMVWRVWEGLPAVLVGAIYTTVQSGGDVKKAWVGALAGALAVPLHHLLKALPFIPYRGELGEVKLPPLHPRGVGPALALIFAASLVLGGGTACSSVPSPQTVQQAASQGRDSARLAYSVAAVALTKLADVQFAFANKPDPTPAEYEVALKALNALQVAKAALVKAKPWLETGEGEAEAKQALRDGLDSVALVVMLLGERVPPEIGQGIELARAAIAGLS